VQNGWTDLNDLHVYNVTFPREDVTLGSVVDNVAHLQKPPLWWRVGVNSHVQAKLADCGCRWIAFLPIAGEMLSAAGSVRATTGNHGP